MRVHVDQAGSKVASGRSIVVSPAAALLRWKVQSAKSCPFNHDGLIGAQLSRAHVEQRPRESRSSWKLAPARLPRLPSQPAWHNSAKATPIGRFLAPFSRATMNSSKLSSRHLVVNWLSERGEYTKTARGESLETQILDVRLFSLF